jgi:hypothetical protein
MRRTNLTTRMIEALKSKPDRIVVLRDATAAGLALKALPSGRKVYVWSRRRDKRAVDHTTHVMPRTSETRRGVLRHALVQPSRHDLP